MSEHLPVSLTVLMGTRDVTDWVESVSFSQQSNVLYSTWTIVLAGWHNYEVGARWDIYGSYDSTVPRAETLLRQGIVPPDSQPKMTVDGDVPRMTVTAHSAVWLAQRRRPRQTLVFAPGSREASRVVAKYSDPIGRYSTVVMSSRMYLSQVVNALGNMAGLRVSYQMRDLKLASFVMPPGNSYWRQISELVKPVAPYIYYQAETNTLVLTDPIGSQAEVGTAVSLPGNLIKSVKDLEVQQRRVQRVIVRVPR